MFATFTLLSIIAAVLIFGGWLIGLAINQAVRGDYIPATIITCITLFFWGLK